MLLSPNNIVKVFCKFELESETWLDGQYILGYKIIDAKVHRLYFQINSFRGFSVWHGGKDWVMSTGEIKSTELRKGEGLSKKQAAQESTIRKLRVQIRDLEEEKKCLTTKLQVEENKVESIKREKTATEKVLQETIEKHQNELAAQKEYYTNALAAAKEAQTLAEAQANNEARTELESRLREVEERESMLVQTIEELRQTLCRKE
uniref:Golgin candidate 5-like n=1 Tax=Cicer arietinum TaxID=3827 RepID=A0A3Q7XQT9_CICAR|nr:golgin candidate 5-like [Cicer arietinum]